MDLLLFLYFFYVVFNYHYCYLIDALYCCCCNIANVPIVGLIKDYLILSLVF